MRTKIIPLVWQVKAQCNLATLCNLNTSLTLFRLFYQNTNLIHGHLFRNTNLPHANLYRTTNLNHANLYRTTNLAFANLYRTTSPASPIHSDQAPTRFLLLPHHRHFMRHLLAVRRPLVRDHLRADPLTITLSVPTITLSVPTTTPMWKMRPPPEMAGSKVRPLSIRLACH